MYKYETHLHTMETSRCGYVRAADQVKIYKDLGYTGICVTDHLHSLYLSLMDCHDNWHACMDRWLYGYRLAKEAGEKCGLEVILGMELRFPENESDYLIYGIDEKWVYDHPFIDRMDHQSFFDTYGKEVLIIHAHPYRNCDEVFHTCVHGLEIANCNPRHPSRNELALKLAQENPRLYRTVGSDAHRPGDEGRAAVCFERPVHNSHEYAAAIESGAYHLWCPEYDKIVKESEKNV
ncbi:MAG: PHP domain-containing protein [Oscillospiraceae bacterium]|nr:PHP domain-containing protein [Oscillospiraceae bacterium]